jgi:hypothetical protein
MGASRESYVTAENRFVIGHDTYPEVSCIDFWDERFIVFGTVFSVHRQPWRVVRKRHS